MFMLLTLLSLLSHNLSNPQQHPSFLKTRIPQLNSRIVGGTETTIDRYPHQISLEYYNAHTCGGSLITTKYVVSAGHCVAGKENYNFRIRAGTSIRGTGGIVIGVQSFILKDCFNYFYFDCDLSVITLVSDITLGSSIALIALPVQNQPVIDGTMATVTGWGTTTEGGGAVDVLRMVQVPIYNHEQCDVNYANENITQYMICAGEDGKDSCQGDSGGPMIIDGLLIGVVSWGSGCGRPNLPGVYASVPALRKFITDHTGV